MKKVNEEIAIIWEALYDKLWSLRGDEVVNKETIFVRCGDGCGRGIIFGEFYELREGVEYEYKVNDADKYVTVMYNRAAGGVLLSFSASLK